MSQADTFDSAWGQVKSTRAHVTFSGRAGEYFKIWIVNVFLTVITLGIYLARAKVRTRRYFYWNTHLAGHNFDYLAKPGAILLGHALVTLCLIGINRTEELWPNVGWYLSTLAYFSVPWLVYKAHRFKARYSCYRGIRFSFAGTILEAYKAWALLPGFFAAALVLVTFFSSSSDMGALGLLVLPLILGALLAYPYWSYLRKAYTFGNMGLGSTTASFNPDYRYFYSTYLKAGLLALGAFLLSILATGIFSGLGALSSSLADLNFAAFAAPVATLALSYFLMEQYIYARITNHCWNNLKLGPLTFEADLEPGKLVWLRVSNALAVVASFGLLTPWAAIRRFSYIASRFTVIGAEELDTFLAASDSEVNALGDAAADIIDLDVGW